MTDFLHENILGDIELDTINKNGKRLYVTPDVRVIRLLQLFFLIIKNKE